MKMFWILFSALFFATGDYMASVGGEKNKLWLTVMGAIVGGFGYLAFGWISKQVPLSSLAGYVNGVVVVIGVMAGVLLKNEKVNAVELLFIAVILFGILGLAYVQTLKT